MFNIGWGYYQHFIEGIWNYVKEGVSQILWNWGVEVNKMAYFLLVFLFP